MKTLQQTLSKIESFKNTKMRIGRQGLRINEENDSKMFKTIDELLEAIKDINTERLYSIEVEVSEYMFLQVIVKVSYLKENEIGVPHELVKMARSINTFDNDYQRSDDYSVYRFWNNLKLKLSRLLNELNNNQKEVLRKLVTNEKFAI